MIHFAVEDTIMEMMGVNDTVAAVIPCFACWHLLFWFCRIFSSKFFSSYDALDGSTKSYWSASMVSTVHAILIVPMAINAGFYLDFHDISNIYITSPQSFQVKYV
jgi:hypothetical protein